MSEEKNAILIAEDEEINRTILREILKDKYEVLEAENGHQAIYRIKADYDKIALIILDIHMPKLDGYGVMDYLADSSLNEKIPVIITTSDQSTDVLISGKKNKVADIVYKPFRASEIRKRVDNLIEICKYEQNLESVIAERATYLTKQYDTITRLSNIDSKDNYIAITHELLGRLFPNSLDHISRISKYTEIFCRELQNRFEQYGLDKEECMLIKDASLLHDLGNLVIDDVYNQGEGASHRAIMQIKKRPEAAGELVNLIFTHAPVADNRKKYAYEICRCMYEQFDGKGYPEGLTGLEIPISAQVVGLAHRYDELRFGSASVKAEFHKTAIRKILESEYKAYNPDLCDILEDVENELSEICD